MLIGLVMMRLFFSELAPVQFTPLYWVNMGAAAISVLSGALLLDLTNRIRALDGVMSTETFLYLDMVKQLYDWGTHVDGDSQ